MTRSTPTSIDELRAAIGDALAAEEPMEVIAGGSKRGLGRPMQTPRTLDLSGIAGIRSYQPNELVLTAGAATPLDEIAEALAEARQMLAFEPPDWRKLLSTADSRPTLGGALACNLSGPRRIKAGAARDHLLGFRAVSGRGEIFKSGGRVVKNVTGYDLSKLMVGSYGTLAALEEVTVKVLPRPERIATVVLCGLDPAAAVRAMRHALASAHDVSAAAYLPAGSVPAPMAMVGIAALRLEGPEPSVAYRRGRLLAELGADCESAVLDGAASVAFWRAVRDAEPFAAPADRAVWRVSAAPSRGAEIGEAIARHLDALWYLDWGGGLVWVAVSGAEDGGAALIRAAIRGADGHGTGHATLIRGAAALRRAVPVFEPQPPALAALAARVKDSFDPRHILNPGRMVERS
ncbi:MAG TPA: glycolate oxidase subunit GlcE [Stellaceae bacterium]|nr:glycolate oxidase subunit GlcE [Stellaceae bacterium]HXC15647.1 glycolate oxidase subunit GlcE [Stellaceae bacterium]